MELQQENAHSYFPEDEEETLTQRPDIEHIRHTPRFCFLPYKRKS